MATPSPSPNSSPTPSPYITAPSSPIHFADDHIQFPDSSRSSMAFDWDDLIPKSFDGDDNGDEDYGDITFEFCVDQFQSFSLPAEELFDDGKIRTLEPPPPIQLGTRSSSPPPLNRSIPQSKRQIIWSSRRSYDFSYPFEARVGDHRLRRNERGKTTSFGGSKSSKLNRLINLLSFRRPPSSERASSSTSSKASASFGSTGSSSSGSGSVSGYSVRYLSGSVQEPDDGYGVTRRDEVKSCLTPCKQRILSCFVKKL